MTDINDTIATYFDAWNTANAGRRAELCRAVLAEDGRYVDPLGDATGPEGFAAFVEGVRAQHPGLTLRRSSGIDLHHDCARFAWEAVAEDGTVAVAGIDVVLLARDGRLQAVTGFMGEPATVEVPA